MGLGKGSEFMEYRQAGREAPLEPTVIERRVVHAALLFAWVVVLNDSVMYH